LALADFHQVIKEEPRYYDAYWQRHLILVTLNQQDKALEDLDFILKYQRNHSGAYLSRLFKHELKNLGFLKSLTPGLFVAQ
jgi:hypothetical protein